MPPLKVENGHRERAGMPPSRELDNAAPVEALPATFARDVVPEFRGVPLKVHRLHHLDWIRVVMILCVVYAHLAFSGLVQYEKVMEDDRAYTPYAEGHSGTPSLFLVRWVSVLRQWCIPLLFWVSGAAAACSFKKKKGNGVGKLLMLSLVGVASNGSVWMLGPHNANCWPLDHDKPECEGGRFFHFSVVAGTGDIFPWIYQMWYTMLLAVIVLINLPFMNVLAGRRGLFSLFFQWIVTVALLGFVLQFASGGALLGNIKLPESYEKYAWLASVGEEYFESPSPVPDALLVFKWLSACEAAFLFVSYLLAPRRRGPCCRIRFLHYVAAGIMVLTLAAPLASEIGHISPCFLVFLLNLVNRSFQMGFMMTRPVAMCEGDADDGKVKPMISKAWPAVIMIVTFCAPSTNYYAAGNLTYPYFPRVEDRCLYVGGAICAFFLVDRLGQTLDISPTPPTFAWTALLLYLFHPWIITVFIEAGLRAPADDVRRSLFTEFSCVWFLSVLVVFLFVQGFVTLNWCCRAVCSCLSRWCCCCRCCCRRKGAAAARERLAAGLFLEDQGDTEQAYERLLELGDEEEERHTAV